MTITAIEGFDVLTTALIASKYPNGAQFSPAMSTGRFGTGQSYTPGPGNQNGEWSPLIAPAPAAAFAFGLAMLIPSATIAGAGTGVRVVGFLDSGGNTQARIMVAADGTVRAVSGVSTVMASSAAGVFTPDVFHYLECEFVLSDTVGVFKIWVDGVLVVNVTTGDTKGAAATTVFRLQITPSGMGQGGMVVDDYYQTDGARLGEARVVTLMPSSDTADKDWGRSAGSDNYALVDERPSDGDTTYVTSSTVGDQDYYGMEDLSFTPAAIYAVQSSIIARKDDAADRAVRANIKSSASVANGTALGLAAGYQQRVTIHATDPNGGGAWTASGVNALQAGPETTI